MHSMTYKIHPLNYVDLTHALYVIKLRMLSA